MKPILPILALFVLPLFGCAATRLPESSRDHLDVIQSDFVMKDFHFASGESLPELKIHYRTLGRPQVNEKGEVSNAILILHGTTGDGAQFLRPEFANELYGPNQPFDIDKYFIILPDDIGHGQSSRPSESLHAHFPAYCYADMVEAEHRLVFNGLNVHHLRLVMGTSMGGMHTWLWGETFPDDMDALMPLASLPEPIAGRNRVWRKMISESIRTDPEWKGGDYEAQPRGLRFAIEMLYFMASNPRLRYVEAPTRDKADQSLAAYVDRNIRTMDANNVLYAVESSRDYDPEPNLEKIKAPLLAINSADDLINPPDQGILEKQIKRVPHGTAVVLPETDKTVGHGSHTTAMLWKDRLVELLKETQK